jgi:hypothetical protein
VSDEQLKTLSENGEKVIAMRKAYPDEQLANIDIKYHTAYNSYVSRHFNRTQRFAGFTGYSGEPSGCVRLAITGPHRRHFCTRDV